MPQKVRRRMTIGRHGVVTAEEARRLALAALGALLGSKLVIDLTTPDINRFLRDVAGGKTARIEKTMKLRGKSVMRGGLDTASRTTGLLGSILSYAVSEGIIQANPAQGVKRSADNRRLRRLTPEEYRRLGGALDNARADGETDQVIDGSWLLALSGCRLGEIVNLKWSEVDKRGGHCAAGRASCSRLRYDDQALGELPHSSFPCSLRQGVWRPRQGLRREKRSPRRRDATHSAPLLCVGRRRPRWYGAYDRCPTRPRGGSVTSRYVHYLDRVPIAAADGVVAEIVRKRAPRIERQAA